VRVVLTGGIGAGKSTAASVFARHGAEVVSADAVAASVLDVGEPAVAQVAARWPQVVASGVVDRSALGRIVFADAGALAELEAIVHPETRRRIEAAVAVAEAPAVVVEIPILRDWFAGWTVVVVDAPVEVRVQRILDRREGAMARTDVDRVLARQPSRSEWLLAADYVLDNGSDPARLEEECGRLWRLLAHP